MAPPVTRQRSSAALPVPGALANAIVAWAPLLLIASAIFWQSSQPGFGQPDMLSRLGSALFGGFAWYGRIEPTIQAWNWAGSYIGHFVEYALFGLAALWAVRRQWPDSRRAYAIAFAIAALYALSDELHQYFIPGRHCDWKDVLTDMLGAAIALAVVRLWQSQTQ